MGRDYAGGMDQMAGGVVGDEENKVMYDAGMDNNLQMSLADHAMNGEDYNCRKCGNTKPPITETTGDDYIWIECNKCEKWSHADCVKDKLKKQGVIHITNEAIERIDQFFCCDGE